MTHSESLLKRINQIKNFDKHQSTNSKESSVDFKVLKRRSKRQSSDNSSRNVSAEISFKPLTIITLAS